MFFIYPVYFFLHYIVDDVTRFFKRQEENVKEKKKNPTHKYAIKLSKENDITRKHFFDKN
jgi:hypothetical protein